jgi:hypothetical protein
LREKSAQSNDDCTAGCEEGFVGELVGEMFDEMVIEFPVVGRLTDSNDGFRPLGNLFEYIWIFWSIVVFGNGDVKVEGLESTSRFVRADWGRTCFTSTR